MVMADMLRSAYLGGEQRRSRSIRTRPNRKLTYQMTGRATKD